MESHVDQGGSSPDPKQNTCLNREGGEGMDQGEEGQRAGVQSGPGEEVGSPPSKPGNQPRPQSTVTGYGWVEVVNAARELIDAWKKQGTAGLLAQAPVLMYALGKIDGGVVPAGAVECHCDQPAARDTPAATTPAPQADAAAVRDGRCGCRTDEEHAKVTAAFRQPADWLGGEFSRADEALSALPPWAQPVITRRSTPAARSRRAEVRRG